jgi:hypothetical protein
MNYIMGDVGLPLTWFGDLESSEKSVLSVVPYAMIL